MISFLASIKMKLNGCSIVLNDDGTEIMDDEALEMVKNQTLILLQPNEAWKPDNSGDVSGTSTLTLQSSSSGPSTLSPFSECDDEATNIENGITISSDDGTQIVQATANQDTISDENMTNEIGVIQKEVDHPPIFIVVSPSGSVTAPASEDTRLSPINESTWQNFQLPLDKIPKYMINACEIVESQPR